MATYYKQEDVLNIIKDYDDCDELLEDLLSIDTYTKDGEPEKINTTNNITNINFICDNEKIKELMKSIMENNEGKIIGFELGDKND